VKGATELAERWTGRCSHICILSYQIPKRVPTHDAAGPAAQLKPRPPPYLPHAPSRPLCIHKAVIRACCCSLGAQGSPSTLLWQHGSTTDSRSASKPAFQLRYQAFPTVVTRYRRFCGCISSLANGRLETLCDHSCMLSRMSCPPIHYLTHLAGHGRRYYRRDGGVFEQGYAG
jgi:hypothetical protein